MGSYVEIASSGTVRIAGTMTGGPAGSVAQSGTVFVSTGGSNSNDGASWGSAKATIAAGIAALPANGGVVEIGYGTFAVSSTGRKDPCTYQGTTTVLDAAAAASDVGSLVIGQSINQATFIVSVAPGVSFTTNNATGSSGSSVYVVKPALTVPVGVTLRGRGSSAQNNGGWSAFTNTTVIQDNGTGVTILTSAASGSNLSARTTFEQLSIWGNSSNMYGLYNSNGLFMVKVDNSDVSYHGIAGVVTNLNQNMWLFLDTLFNYNGTAGATIPSGGVLMSAPGNQPSSAITFVNCQWNNNYGFGLTGANSLTNATPAQGATLVSCAFTLTSTSALAGSGVAAVIGSGSDGVSSCYACYFEQSTSYNVQVSGQVAFVGCQFQGGSGTTSQHSISLTTSGASLIGCTFQNASGSSVVVNGHTFSWSGCVSGDSAWYGTVPVGAAAATGSNAAMGVFLGGAVTADPHVAGQVWSNSGVLTLSAG